MGDDEARARAALAEMLARVSAGPRTTLGVGDSASPDQVRSAFLALTKRFHPARFGRMSSDIQRLSNEVFLAIKSAHDTLLRGSRSGAMPVITDELSAGVRTTPLARQTGAFPATQRPSATQPPPIRGATPAAPSTYRGTPVAPAGGSSSSGATPAYRGAPLTPAGGSSSSAAPTYRGAPIAPSNGPTTSRTLAPARSIPTPSAGSPAISRPGTPPGAGSGGRPGTPPNAVTRNVRRPSTPPGERTSTVRSREPEFDEQAALQQARDLLATRNWGSARQALQALAARMPQSRHYRALLCYARGREAHASGRHDDAALEYQRALQLEPELGLAKQALGELPPRRR